MPHLEGKGFVVSERATDAGVRRKEEPSDLTGDGGAEVHANLRARIKRQEPTTWTPQVERRLELKIAHALPAGIASKTLVVSKQWLKIAARIARCRWSKHPKPRGKTPSGVKVAPERSLSAGKSRRTMPWIKSGNCMGLMIWPSAVSR